MEIVPIFAKHLFAVRYDEDDPDEFEKLFTQWSDIEYLEEFFETHKRDLENGFYRNTTVEDAVFITKDQASQLEQKLKQLSTFPIKSLPESLDRLFRPLDKNLTENELAKSKAYGFPSPSWLRVYAIKVSQETYIVTGGAIKLTQYMSERDHTAIELRKLNRTVDFLKEQGIIDREGFEELEF